MCQDFAHICESSLTGQPWYSGWDDVLYHHKLDYDYHHNNLCKIRLNSDAANEQAWYLSNLLPKPVFNKYEKLPE